MRLEDSRPGVAPAPRLDMFIRPRGRCDIMASPSTAQASLERNKELVRDCYETVWNRRRTDRVADYSSSVVVIHSATSSTERLVRPDRRSR